MHTDEKGESPLRRAIQLAPMIKHPPRVSSDIVELIFVALSAGFGLAGWLMAFRLEQIETALAVAARV